MDVFIVVLLKNVTLILARNNLDSTKNGGNVKLRQFQKKHLNK